MSKKMICLVSVIVLAVLSVSIVLFVTKSRSEQTVAQSEQTVATSDFTLRNGIHFGDTKEEVMAKETIPFEEGTHGLKEIAENELWTEFGKVAGLSFHINYLFDENDKLTEVVWEKLNRTKEESDTDYKQIEDAMTSKYGQPLGFCGGKCYVIVGDAFIRVNNYIEENRNLGYDSYYTQYTEWDYKYQEGKHVKIEMMQYYDGVLPHFVVGYKFFSSEEIEEKIIEKLEEKEKIKNDI